MVNSVSDMEMVLKKETRSFQGMHLQILMCDRRSGGTAPLLYFKTAEKGR